MKILFIVPYTPNLIRVRPYNLIRSLTDKGNEVWVYTVWTNEEEKKDIEDLKQYAFNVEGCYQSRFDSYRNSLQAVFSQKPLQSVYSFNKNLFTKILEVLEKEKFDVIHIEHLRGSHYGVSLLKELNKLETRPKIVWDSVDCISMLFKQAIQQGEGFFARAITNFDLGRTATYEKKLVQQFDEVLVTSRLDRAALLEGADLTGKHLVHILPNGVDLDFFKPDPETPRDEATLVVSGKMSYHANQAMVNFLFSEIMPLVWKRRSDVKLIIAGKDPSPVILNMQSERVIVTGTVSDLRPYLHKATIAVAPLVYGAGIQNKVLEAMACATPVICTSKAVAALEVTPEKDLVIADSADEFAEKILNLLDDTARQKEIGMAGLKYVNKNHDWKTIIGRLEKIYQAGID